MGRPRKKPTLLETFAARGEQRCFPRIGVRIPLVCEDELGEPLLALTATNLSAGGLYLEGDVPFRIGSRVLLALPLPRRTTDAGGPVPPEHGAGETLRLVGEIVRAEQVEPMQRRKGMGIRFIEVPRATREQLERWLTRDL
ncbi:MAG: PilZ domain-containing protein [Deltaproteobacteria bacterium]|nr:PilZ domain-containing protein [Deltaproteobacteria bacterium]